MVQVIENRTDVDGRVVMVQQDAARSTQRLVTIEIEAANAVGSFPNLFVGSTGKQVEVVLPKDLTTKLKVGDAVQCRIRRAGPNMVIGERCTPRP